MFANDFSIIRERRREFEKGVLEPRILGAGPIVDGTGAPWPHSIIVNNAADARAAVDKIKKEGFDYVKTYSALNIEAYFALADEAKKHEIPYAGHVPDSVSVSEASNAGQKSFVWYFTRVFHPRSRITKPFQRPSPSQFCRAKSGRRYL
jgi:hypothetical protein